MTTTTVPAVVLLRAVGVNSAATVMLEVVPAVAAATGGGNPSRVVGLPNGCGERRTTWLTEGGDR